MATVTTRKLTFDDLTDWAADNHQAALDVFVSSVGDLNGPVWPPLAKVTAENRDPRRFFEENFQPVLIEDGRPMLFTGYFEPELPGALRCGGPYQYPIYRVPDELAPNKPFATRREIDADGILAGRNLEIAWLVDPVDRFFLQVQGSGRIRLPDGGMIRVGFSAKNGFPYTSIGKVMIARGLLSPDAVSPDAIRAWVQNNGDQGRALLCENESYVFFRKINEIPADQGPLGAMNRSITPGRSIAVDPEFVTLGAPVWIEKTGTEPINRLMVAQDTGSAIKGAQRADIFMGTGDVAGKNAGMIKDGGRMIVLQPLALADRL